MRKTLVLFMAAGLYLAASLYSGGTAEAETVIVPDSCYQLMTISFKHNGTVLWRGRVTAFELLDTFWHVYINGIDSFQFHQDSLESLQMMY